MAPFGYQPVTITGLIVTAGQNTERNIAPVALPFTRVIGQVKNTAGQPVQAMISVPGTPIELSTTAAGTYDLVLPQGTYELVAAATGYRLGRIPITLNQAGTIITAFNLTSAPRILLINDGLWHYQDFGEPYQQSLYDAGYAFSYHPIHDPYNDVPSVATLSAYDVVIWASPRYSPNYIEGGNALEDYLNQGGNVLIFGPNVAQYDGGTVLAHRWFNLLLRGRFTGRQSPPFALEGVALTPFTDLSFNLNSSGSNNNLIKTDQVRPQENTLTQPVLTYANGSIAGLQSGLCDPYQLVYLGFGLETVEAAATRTQLVQRSFEWLMEPPHTQGVTFFPTQVDDLAFGGRTLPYTITVRTISETLSDTLTLSLAAQTWPTQIMTTTLTLGPCEVGQTVVTITIPENLPSDTHHTITLQVASANTPGNAQQLLLHHKTPGHVLFVDDDRFYDTEQSLLSALETNGIPFDRWETGWNPVKKGSPTLAEMVYYDLVLWYTGYDWYAPITAAELQALEQYLAQGGRLLLTSQDYLYYHPYDSLTYNYFGVQGYFEEAAPTLVVAEASLRQAGLHLPLPLDVRPYQNFGDGLILAAGEPVMWQNSGLPGAVANQGPATNGHQWRTMFWSFPLEKLPAPAQTVAMNGIVGWLSDLGDSTMVVDEAYIPTGGATRVFTITLHNQGTVTHTVTAVNSLPKFLDIDLSSVTGGAVYNPVTRQLTWQGVMAAGEVKVIRYHAAAIPSITPGTRLNNQLSIHIAGQDFVWRQIIPLWVGVPDLRHSTITVTPADPTRDQPITYTLTLHNQSNLPAPAISSTLFLPLPLVPITDTMVSSSGVITLTQAGLQWQGGLAPGETVTMSLVLTATAGLETQWLSAAALIADGFTDPFLITHQMPLMAPYQIYLPWLPRWSP
ncbi:MAG: hypothetical protein IPL78_08960 [Chloroflexi bacterium]|nr:hypothetical protein [Chloroflexota bacterium]